MSPDSNLQNAILKFKQQDLSIGSYSKQKNDGQKYLCLVYYNKIVSVEYVKIPEYSIFYEQDTRKKRGL